MEATVDSPQVGFRILDHGLEVAGVLQSVAHAFGVFFQLGSIEGSGKNVFQEDGAWYPERLQVLHGSAQLAAGDVLVPLECNLANLNLWPFLHVEGYGYSRRRNLLHLNGDVGELAPVFRQQVLEGDLGLDDLGRIVRTVLG